MEKTLFVTDNFWSHFGLIKDFDKLVIINSIFLGEFNFVWHIPNLYNFYKDGEDVYGCDYGQEGLEVAKSKGMINMVSGDLSTLSILAHQPARRPDLSSLEARMKTFADWPPGLEQRPAKLANAGFYYISTFSTHLCYE